MTNTESTDGQKTPSVLRSHADRCMAYFAAQIEPQIGYARKLPNIVEAIQRRIKAPHWNSTAEKYVIRETNKKFIYQLDHQVFYCQTLGLEPWIENLDDHLEVISIAFSKMDVTRIKRLGFQVSIQLPLEMSHSEICDLMFGSYLIDRAEMSSIYGNLDDALVQLHGSYKGIKSQTNIVPQTIEQSRKTFLSAGNLDAFVEPKFLDTCIKDHYERVSTDSLCLMIEMVKEDAPVSTLRSLVQDCFEGAEKIAEGTVLRIKGLKPKE